MNVNVSPFAALVAEAKMFLNLFRNTLLPWQMFLCVPAEETFRGTMFLLQCFHVFGRLKSRVRD